MINLALALTIITALPSNYTQCAVENGTCTITSPSNFIFGASGGYSAPVILTHSVNCNWSIVGGDPNPKVVKACYIGVVDSNVPPPANTASVPASTNPPVQATSCVDPHGFYVPSLIFALRAPNAEYSFFTPKPAMCTDTPKYVTFTDPNTGEKFKQGICSTVYGDFTFTKHGTIRDIKGVIMNSPDTWPTE